MIKYKITQLADRRRKPVKLPPQFSSVGLERSYLAVLRTLEREAASAVRDIIKPAYQQRVSQIKAAITIDADENAFAAFKNRLMSGLQRQINEVSRLLNVEADRHTEAWMASAKRSLGVDLRGVVNRDDVREALEIASMRNASLITNFTEEMVKKVQQATLDALPKGQSYTRLAATIKHELGVSDSRAQLIAKDQSSKLNADLTEIRHKQAGVNKYEWLTSEDERVRPRHRDLNGRIYEYGQPTGAEGGLPPGQPIRCRCVACGVVDWEDETPKKRKMVAEAVEPEKANIKAMQRLRKLNDKTGVEHIIALDGNGRQLFEHTSGMRQIVRMTDSQIKQLQQAGLNAVFHHNHPAEHVGFSASDIVSLIGLRGVKTMFAHARKSSYRATKSAGTAKLTEKKVREAFAYNQTIATMLFNEGRLNQEMASTLWSHMAMEQLRRQKLIDYSVDELPKEVLEWLDFILYAKGEKEVSELLKSALPAWRLKK